MPPIIAILLALFTKEVYLSLCAGCALGALLVAEFHPWVAFDTLFNTMIDSVDFSILMFMILLGMVVMLMQESGGTRAYGEWAAKKLKSKRATLVATSLLGALIFVDDYFNCLTVGSVMRPVTDKYKVSRAKLAYLIDATAAPVCIIAPISSWAAAVNSYVPAGSSMSGFEMFVRTIPFNLYAMLTLYMVFFTSLLGFDFGLMKKHERNAAHGDLFTSGGEAFQNQEIKDPTEGGKFAKGKVIDLIAPMIVMIFTAIATMIWTGYLNGGTNLVEDFANCSSSESLVFAGLVTVGFLLLFYLPRRVIGFKDFMNSVPEGGKLMMPPILILVLAWTLKGMTDALGIGDFVRQAVSLNEGLMRFVPLLIFCIAIFIAFSSGTSWGTFAILVPIVVNMFSETDPTMMIVAVSAVLAASACGEQRQNIKGRHRAEFVAVKYHALFQFSFVRVRNGKQLPRQVLDHKPRHEVFTGVCITTTEWQRSFSAQTEVRFSKLSEEEIIYYVDKFQPMDKAGAYGVQEWIGFIGVENISGSYYNIMGLPVQRLYKELCLIEGRLSKL